MNDIQMEPTKEDTEDWWVGLIGVIAMMLLTIGIWELGNYAGSHVLTWLHSDSVLQTEPEQRIIIDDGGRTYYHNCLLTSDGEIQRWGTFGSQREKEDAEANCAKVEEQAPALRAAAIEKFKAYCAAVAPLYNSYEEYRKCTE